MIHGMRNAAPPFSAAMRGKRHRFPVPTAKPSPARISPHREEKVSCFAKVKIPFSIQDQKSPCQNLFLSFNRIAIVWP